MKRSVSYHYCKKNTWFCHISHLAKKHNNDSQFSLSYSPAETKEIIPSNISGMITPGLDALTSFFLIVTLSSVFLTFASLNYFREKKTSQSQAPQIALSNASFGKLDAQLGRFKDLIVTEDANFNGDVYIHGVKLDISQLISNSLNTSTNEVASLQGQTGDLTLTAGYGITIDGLTISVTGVPGASGSKGDKGDKGDPGSQGAGGATGPAGSGSGGGSGNSPFGEMFGSIVPNNSTEDFLIGGQATASAKFGVLNVNSGTPTATISANFGNNALYITGDGTLATTNRQTLILGNSSTYNTTGNILLNPNGTGFVGIGTTTPTALLDIAGTASISGALKLYGTPTIQSTANQTLTIGGNTTGDISFSPGNSTNAVYFKTGGNVGIGTMTPSEELTLASSYSLGWDNGSGAVDVALSRGAANRLDLATGDSLNIVNGNILLPTNGSKIGVDTSINYLSFGISAGNLDLNASGQRVAINLDTDNDSTTTAFQILRNAANQAGTLLFHFDESGYASIETTGTSGGLYIGGDTQLYRGATNSLYLASGDSLNLVLGALQIAGTTVIDSSRNGSGFTGLTSTGTVFVGQEDTSQGSLVVYGAGAGSTAGGRILFEFAADHDTTTNRIDITGYEDDLLFELSNGTDLALFKNEGQLQLPVTGSGGGLLIGGDTQLYRSAADTLRTPDSLTVDGNFIVSGTCTGCGGGGANLWQINNGVLSPGNQTLDLAFGATSTSSAKLALSLSGTRPVASVAGQTSFAALVVDNSGLGDLFAASSSGLNRFVVKQSGNVGIGTSNPLTLLHLSQAAPSTGTDLTITLGSGGTAGWRSSMILNNATTGGRQYELVSTSNGDGVFGGGRFGILDRSTGGIGSARFVIDSSGNVGIGTVTPLALLDVNGTASVSGALKLYGTPTIQSTANQTLTIGGDTTGDIQFKPANSSTSLYLASSGNVGIGTTTPGITLDIAGATRTNNNFYVNGGTSNITSLNDVVNVNKNLGANVTDSWSTGTSGGTARYWSTSVLYNGKVYAWGGSTGSQINTLDIYDIAAGSWSTGTAGGTARRGHTSVLYNGKMYSWGGVNSGGSAINTVDIYDIANNSWSTGTAGGTARYNHTSVLYNGKVYSWGGTNGAGATINTVDIYDIAAGSWSTGTAGGTARFSHKSVLYNGKMYSWGGRDGSNFDTVDIYDIVKNSWSTGTSGGTARREHTSTLYNGKIYSWGGDTGGTTIINTVDIYDIATASWSTGTAGGTARYEHISVLYNGKIYSWGGRNGGGTALSSVDIYDIGFKQTILALQENGQDTLNFQTDSQLFLSSGKLGIMGGNVGLGTATPSALLDVVGTASISGVLKLYGTPTIQSTANKTLTLGGDTTGDIILYPRNGNGFVGVGTTNPLVKFQVGTAGQLWNGPSAPIQTLWAATQAIGNSGQFAVLSSSAQAADAGAGISLGGNYSSTNSIDFATIFGRKDDSSNGTFGGYFQISTRNPNGSLYEGMRITSAGNVGIGTTTPTAKLQVFSNLGTSPAASFSGTTAGPALLVTNDGVGDLFAASSSGSINFRVKNNGDLVVGNGAGKITSGTFDPLYTIDGGKYSTFAPSMIGVKEEYADKAVLVYDSQARAYVYTLNFNTFEHGSDLWVFSRVIDPDISTMSILLTPNSAARTWYRKDTVGRKITFYADRATELSYRLTAPRFDFAKWGTHSDETETLGLVPYAPPLAIDTPLSFAQDVSQDPLFTLLDSGGILNPQYKDLILTAAQVQNLIQEQAAVLGISTGGISTISAQLQALSSNFNTFEQDLNNQRDLTASISATLANLPIINLTKFATGGAVLGITTVDEDFAVFGNTTLSNLSTIGDITIGNNLTLSTNSINTIGEDLQIQPFKQANVSFMNGLVTIDTEGNLKSLGNIRAESITLTENKTVGSGTIPTGEITLIIQTTAVTQSSKILITPTTQLGGKSLYVSEKSNGQSFTVTLEGGASLADIRFDWLIIEAKP